ncbi:E-selectin-like isoform X2 [Crassostrea virginica]
MFAVILFSLLISLPFGSFHPCRFSDLPNAELRHCSSLSEGRAVPLEIVFWGDLPPFTICTFTCNSNGKELSRMCENGVWTGPKCKTVRVKRFWGRRRRRYSPPPPPPPDTTPPTISCPANIPVTADPLQTSAVVTWTEPTAYDTKDGTLGTTRNGPAPGSQFSEGSTNISYSARDSAGNVASCSFSVILTVVRCPAPSYPGSFSCTSGSAYLYGVVCSFDCPSVGYELIGQSSVTCLSSAHWSDSIPTCQRVNCGDPGSPRNGSSVVTGSRYQDTVTYACNTGYNITGDVTRTCLATRLWSGALPTCWYSISCSSSPCLNGATCINTLGGFKCQCGPGWAGDICQTDIQPPVMSDCQNSETILTSQPEAIASWRIPSFHDPMGNPLSVFTNYPSSNSSSFPWGDFTVQYSALKLSNGLREECNFTISVRPIPCSPLPVPVNAAIVCNDWDTDLLQLCVIACKSGYFVPRGYSEDDVYVCGASGTWSPVGAMPECIGTSSSVRNTPSFTDCLETSAQSELSVYFIDLVKKSNFAHICKTSPCDPNRVKIQC